MYNFLFRTLELSLHSYSVLSLRKDKYGTYEIFAIRSMNLRNRSFTYTKKTKPIRTTTVLAWSGLGVVDSGVLW